MIPADRDFCQPISFSGSLDIQPISTVPARKAGFRHHHKPALRQILFWGVALAVSAGLFFFVRYVTACWQLTAPPGIPPSYCGGKAGATQLGTLPAPMNNPASTPEAQAPEVQYLKWDGASRINIVFFGLRGGDISGEDCPECTDTILLLTIDPVAKTAGMLSIRRDLWVNIPGFGFSRINTAWTAGEGAKLPGGGPGLAMKTVSQFIGVPIQYYVQVDFDTFTSLIDLIGGIDVKSDQRIRLDPVGSSAKDHFVMKCCQMYHLSGKRALAYARCRDASQGCNDADVGRAKRQQQVILAVRDKVFRPENFAKLMAQGPQLYSMFSSGIHTNMGLQDALKLVVLAEDLPLENIKQGVIDDNMVSPANVTLDGLPASILQPISDRIRVLRDQIFSTDAPIGPLAQGDPAALMREDAARIRVVNDTYARDLDTRTGNFLIAQGMQVTERGAPTGTSNQTVIILYSPKLYAMKYLINIFGVTNSSQIIMNPDPAETVDIEIRIGEDWVDRLPRGY